MKFRKLSIFEYLLYIGIVAVGILLDQLTKQLAVRYLMPTPEDPLYTVPIIKDVLHLTYAENTGMAFSMLSGHSWLLGLVSLAAVALGWWMLRGYRLGPVSRIAAMLMLGGAVGNMIDRLFRGYVVDMFEALFVEFAVFNVADAALTIGAGLMAASLLFCPEDWKPKK